MDESFDDVYANYGEAVHAYLQRLTGDAWTADELCQETFLRYLERGRDRTRANGSLRPWLFRVATNLAIDGLRRRRGRSLARDPAAGPASRPGASDLEARVRAEVEGLPVELRGTFLLRAHHGLPYREVAVVFGVSERAAKDRFRRARDRLARRLVGEEDA